MYAVDEASIGSPCNSDAIMKSSAESSAPSDPSLPKIPKIVKVDNPLLKAQSKFLASLSSKVKEHFFSDNHVDGESRAKVWMQQADVGEELVNKYAWASPDERAIKILREFSPIVEIGCGANCYWAKMMNEVGIDVVAYDVAVDGGGRISHSGDIKEETKKGKRKRSINDFNPDFDAQQFPIRSGGPEVLSSDPISKSGRSLFLCYPDEDDAASTAPNDDNANKVPVSMGAECLEHFQGDFVIHVGELHGDTISMDQAPWGRSSAPEFQQRLAAEYHCLLKATLPCWLHVRDTISVWKRSDTCTMVLESNSDDKEDKDEEIEYKYIPPEEILPIDAAAPALQHLL